MAVVTLAQSGTNNGTATPATPGSLTTTAGNLLVLWVAVQGTSPTITTPGGWTQLRNIAGASLTFGLFVLPNNAGGATNPSATLGGTVAGWIAIMEELTATGANEGSFTSSNISQSSAQLSNVFSTSGQTLPGQLFVYGVARLGTNTISGALTGLNNWAPPGYPAGASQWSASVQSQSGVQGLSIDTYWGVADGSNPQPNPQSGGLLSGAVSSIQLYFSANSAQTFPSATFKGVAEGGQYVGPFFQGMIGG